LIIDIQEELSELSRTEKMIKQLEDWIFAKSSYIILYYIILYYIILYYIIKKDEYPIVTINPKMYCL